MTYNVTFPHLGLEFNINPVAFSCLLYTSELPTT